MIGFILQTRITDIVLQAQSQSEAAAVITGPVIIIFLAYMFYKTSGNNFSQLNDELADLRQWRIEEARQQKRYNQIFKRENLPKPKRRQKPKVTEFEKDLAKLKQKIDNIEKKVGYRPQDVQKVVDEIVEQLPPEVAREVEASLNTTTKPGSGSGDSFEVGGDLDTGTERDPYGGRTDRPDPDGMFSGTETRTGSDSSVTPPDLEVLPDPEDLPDPETVKKR
jgi:hypothetical protein